MRLYEAKNNNIIAPGCDTVTMVAHAHLNIDATLRSFALGPLVTVLQYLNFLDNVNIDFYLLYILILIHTRGGKPCFIAKNEFDFKTVHLSLSINLIELKDQFVAFLTKI